MKYLIVILTLLAAAAAATSHTLAAGGTVHIFMSELALDHVKDPELKALLEKNKKIVLWASWYPDSGYLQGNQYGEFSHWSDFHNGYIDYIKNEVGPGNKDYDKLVAHFLGAAAHGFQDQAFDMVFLAKTREADGTGQEELDRGLDMVCMFDLGGTRRYRSPRRSTRIRGGTPRSGAW